MNSQTPPPPAPCAVLDCQERGQPQVCPYDGRYHHHGRIHYDSAPPGHPNRGGLQFREERWEFVCNTHYATLVASLEAFRAGHAAKVEEAVQFIRAGFGSMREAFLSDPGGYLAQVAAPFDDATAAQAIRQVSEEWAVAE